VLGFRSVDPDKTPGLSLPQSVEKCGSFPGVRKEHPRKFLGKAVPHEERKI
jgi:hypothetical protein